MTSTPPIESWLQYTHLDKLYGYLPGMTEALPATFGVGPDEYRSVTQRFSDQARQAAQRCSVTRLPPARSTGHPSNPDRPG